MLLEGRIDRADICQLEEDFYINVIDYKSGVESFDLSDAWFGLKLQLLVYLEAFAGAGTEAYQRQSQTRGNLYFRIDDPLVETQRAWLKPYKMKSVKTEAERPGFKGYQPCEVYGQPDQRMVGSAAFGNIG